MTSAKNVKNVNFSPKHMLWALLLLDQK